MEKQRIYVIPGNGSLVARVKFRVSHARPLIAVALFVRNEELLLNEARRLTAAGNFDEAYDYYARLAAEYPSLAGLNDSIADYLRR